MPRPNTAYFSGVYSLDEMVLVNSYSLAVCNGHAYTV